MTKNQKLAIGVSSGCLVVILVILSLVSSAGPSPVISPVASNSGPETCEAKNDLWGYDGSTDTWTEKSSMLVIGRFSAVAFSIGSRGYVGTGQDNDGVYRKDFWEWNQDNEDINALPVWTQKAEFEGSARKEAVGFSIGDEGYIGTGRDANGASSDFWQWSLATNKWVQMAPFGGGVRQEAVGFSIGDKGYIGTGQDAGGVHKSDFWEFDPDGDPATGMGSWTQKAPFGGGFRFGAVGFSIGNKGYIGTGDSEEQFLPVVTHKDFWEWDQATDKWTQMAPFGGGLRSRAVGYSTLGNGRGYIGTGVSGEPMDTSYKKDFWEFDPAGDPITGMGSWTQKADVGGEVRAGAVGFSIRDYGYIATGYGCEEEPPVACTPNSWTKKENVGGLARVYATGFSIGNKGYIGTGTTTSGNLKDFWEFDPSVDVDGAWTQMAEFDGGPRFRAVGFSIGTKGYIGTGTTDDSFGLNDFWEWDQATNLWDQKENVGGFGRLGAVGFSIVDANGVGKGYIGTGLSSGTTVLRDFYEYNPATDVWTLEAPFGGGVRMGAVGFSVGNKGYVGTGASGNLFATLFNDFWEYNPATNLWTPKAPFSGVIRKEAVGFSIVNALGIERGYIGTGFGENGALRDFRRYDPVSDKWDPKANYGGGQNIEAVGFGMGGRGYLGTGFPTGNGFWEYCPD